MMDPSQTQEMSQDEDLEAILVAQIRDGKENVPSSWGLL